MNDPHEELRELYAPKKAETVWIDLPASVVQKELWRVNHRKGSMEQYFVALVDLEVVSGLHSGNFPIHLTKWIQAKKVSGVFRVTETALIYALKKQCVGRCELKITLANGSYYPIEIFG